MWGLVEVLYWLLYHSEKLIEGGIEQKPLKASDYEYTIVYIVVFARWFLEGECFPFWYYYNTSILNDLFGSACGQFQKQMSGSWDGYFKRLMFKPLFLKCSLFKLRLILHLVNI